MTQKNRLKQNAGGIGDRLFSVMIGKAVIPAHLSHEQTVAFHGRVRFLRETAAFRPGAGFAEPAAAGAKGGRKNTWHIHDETYQNRGSTKKPSGTGIWAKKKKVNSFRYSRIKTIDLIWQVAPKKILAYLLLYAYVNIPGFGCDLTFSA